MNVRHTGTPIRIGGQKYHPAAAHLDYGRVTCVRTHYGGGGRSSRKTGPNKDLHETPDPKDESRYTGHKEADDEQKQAQRAHKQTLAAELVFFLSSPPSPPPPSSAERRSSAESPVLPPTPASPAAAAPAAPPPQPPPRPPASAAEDIGNGCPPAVAR